MMKEIQAERGGALVLAALVVMSMISSMLFKDTEVNEKDYSVMPFPAYYTENPQNIPQIDEINSAMPFNCKVEWPQGWTLSEDPGDVNWPVGELYTPLYIYDENNTPVGYIGFNVFEPVEGEVSDSEYHKTVWPALRLGSTAVWDPFTPVLTGFASQIGIVDIEYMDYTQAEGKSRAEVPHIITNGILAYDTGLKTYVGIAFMPGVMTRDQAIELAMTVRLYAA
ncbi:MAG: hypothetical protein IJ410_06275 [Oscillospiraceae bacterium]|nr:hypothetical protein [Oscillospiraceae bacterium]